MRPSVEYVERKFDEYNALIFGGKLPKLPFKISSARLFSDKSNISEKRMKMAHGTIMVSLSGPKHEFYGNFMLWP